MHLKLLQKEQFEKYQKELMIWLAKKKKADRNKVSKPSPQNSSEPVKNEHDSKIPKKRYISPWERQKLLMTWD